MEIRSVGSTPPTIDRRCQLWDVIMKGRAASSLQLSDREHEILQRLADGLSDQEIADGLYLSLNTIKWYNRQIYAKLGVSGPDFRPSRVPASFNSWTAAIYPRQRRCHPHLHRHQPSLPPPPIDSRLRSRALSGDNVNGQTLSAC